MKDFTRLCSLLLLLLGAVFLLACTNQPRPETGGTISMQPVGDSQTVSPDEAPAEPDWVALGAARLPMLERCELPGVAEPLLCGTIEVREDRAVANGRTIGLKVVVVPAKKEHPPDDPVFVFEGGPGGAATGRAAE